MAASGHSYDQWTQAVTAARLLGDVERCLQSLREGLEHGAASPEPHLFAGECYAALGYYLEALQNYDAAARLAPEGSRVALEALLCGACLLAELGFYQEAATRFEAVKALDQTEAHGAAGRGPSSRIERQALALELAQTAVHMARFEDPKAVGELLERSLSLAETAQARLELARLCLAHNEPAKALEHLEQGRRLDGTHPGFQTLAARCYLALGQLKNARDATLRAELLGDRSRSGRVLRLESKTWQDSSPGASSGRSLAGVREQDHTAEGSSGGGP